MQSKFFALGSLAAVAAACFCVPVQAASVTGSAPSGTTGPSVPASPTLEQRKQAARQTVANNPQCTQERLGDYYWEIGDGSGPLVRGLVGGQVTAQTGMNIASASKWLYASYVVQKRPLQQKDVSLLNFTSGYLTAGLPSCPGAADVASCFAGREGYVAEAEGRFDYDSGHMQHHAEALMGLGGATVQTLASELRTTLGDFGFLYTQPQLAGGVYATANGYAGFLRAILNDQLAIAPLLGSNKVCTQPSSGCNAIYSPLSDEAWNYSLGHWVEDDPHYGDHAFSSTGAAGFYPWIDRTHTYYGILARESFGEAHAASHSIECGRLIRQAWVTGVPVPTDTYPTPQ